MMGDDSESEMSEEDMVEGPAIWGDLEDNDFGQRLAEFAVFNDPDDTEWIPVALRQKKEKKGEKVSAIEQFHNTHLSRSSIDIHKRP